MINRSLILENRMMKELKNNINDKIYNAIASNIYTNNNFFVFDSLCMTIENSVNRKLNDRL